MFQRLRDSTKRKETNMSEQVYTFKTPNLLAKSFMRNGKPCADSFMRILAKSTAEAQNKYLDYVRYGKKIGFYRA